MSSSGDESDSEFFLRKKDVINGHEKIMISNIGSYIRNEKTCISTLKSPNVFGRCRDISIIKLFYNYLGNSDIKCLL